MTQPEDEREVLIKELGSDSEEDLRGLRDPRDPGDLAGHIAVRRPAPMSLPPNTSQTGPVQPETPQSIETEESGFNADDLLLDAKFYQDTAIELQNAYDTLQHRYAQQAHLIQEASGALHAAETQVSQ